MGRPLSKRFDEAVALIRAGVPPTRAAKSVGYTTVVSIYTIARKRGIQLPRFQHLSDATLALRRKSAANARAVRLARTATETAT